MANVNQFDGPGIAIVSQAARGVQAGGVVMGDDIARITDHPVFGFINVYWSTKIGLDWDHPLAKNLLPTRPAPGEPAFYELPDLYPVTVAQARYGGSYEGGEWLAFPCRPHEIDRLCKGWQDSDIECMQFWEEVKNDPERWIIGRGSSANLAYFDLIFQVKAIAKSKVS